MGEKKKMNKPKNNKKKNMSGGSRLLHKMLGPGSETTRRKHCLILSYKHTKGFFLSSFIVKTFNLLWEDKVLTSIPEL